MHDQFKDFISSIENSRLPKNKKDALILTLQKNGITQKFVDLFKQSLSDEMQRRREVAAPLFPSFDAQFPKLLTEFEKESITLEQELSEKVSTLDPLDTAGEQKLLDTYTSLLKNQRSEYEKKVRDLTVAFLKASRDLS